MSFFKTTTLFTLLFLAVQTLTAQQFLEPADSYSPKKISYLTMADGTEQEVYLKSFKREKGLIKEMKIEDKDGNKLKIKPEDIKFMYLPQSGFDKFSKQMDFLYDVQKWDNQDINQGRIADGYIYFEQAEVKVKDKKQTLMMQLLNPSFCSKIRVYHDPYAAETASVGVGGFTLAGGDDKSYYVSAGGKTAFKLVKKNYDEEFSKLFGKCAAIKEKYKDAKWSEFSEAVHTHSQSCE